jgi:hypothetical protein
LPFCLPIEEIENDTINSYTTTTAATAVSERLSQNVVSCPHSAFLFLSFFWLSVFKDFVILSPGCAQRIAWA